MVNFNVETLLLMTSHRKTNFSFIRKFMNSSFLLNMNLHFRQSSCFYNNFFISVIEICAIFVPNQALESSGKFSGPAFWFIAKMKNRKIFKKCEKYIEVRLFLTHWITFWNLEMSGRSISHYLRQHRSLKFGSKFKHINLEHLYLLNTFTLGTLNLLTDQTIWVWSSELGIFILWQKIVFQTLLWLWEFGTQRNLKQDTKAVENLDSS